MSSKFYGERLRQLRLINDKSLLEVGEAILTTKQYIQQLETDVQSPTELTLNALASYFNVAPRFLRFLILIEFMRQIVILGRQSLPLQM